MVRLFRMSIIAMSAVLVLCTMQVDVSAKKKSSKRKSRAARRVSVFVMPQVLRSVPRVVTSPVLSPAADDNFIRALPTLAEKQGKPAASTAPATGSGSGLGNTGSGDSDGKVKQVWSVRPSIRAAGGLIISEFRLQGPNGFADEFIEIYNDTNTSFTVNSPDVGATGFAIAASDGVIRCVIPNGQTIPARGHFLCVNNTPTTGYSLASYPSGNGTTATGNATYTTEITDGEDPDGMGPNPPLPRQGIALFNTTLLPNFTFANRLDAAGPTGEANPLYREGTGLPNLTPLFIEYSWVRDECGKGGAINQTGACPISTPKDTDDNAADFYFVDTVATSAGAGQRLGAPGPQNLGSPIQRNSTITENLLDATAPKSSQPNRFRNFSSDPPNNSTSGTLSIRRRFVNNTGANITRLRFRVIDLNTFPAPFGFADLRVRSSTSVTVSGIDDPTTCGILPTPCIAFVQGTTLEESDGPPPPLQQPNGGAFNSTLSAGTVTLGTPLPPGGSINLQFLFGIMQTGSFRVYVHVEALP